MAIGFRVRTGRAVGIVLGLDGGEPRFVHRRDVDLWDPRMPESRQPYHAALGRATEEAERIVERAVGAVRDATARALDAVLGELDAGARGTAGIGLVVASDRDPSGLGNPHVRAHALEGRLFPAELEAAARSHGIETATFVERDTWIAATEGLGLAREEVALVLKRLGGEAGRPWRTDEKTASMAAWLMLDRARCRATPRSCPRPPARIPGRWDVPR